MKQNTWLNAENLTWLLFAVVVLAIYFFALDIPLLGPDEPRYAQVAREMYLRNDWITPTLGGHTWFEKPALLYWIQHVAFSVFGVTEFAARLGSALFGIGTAGTLFVLGRSLKVVQSSRAEVPVLHEKGVDGSQSSQNSEPRNPEPETRNSPQGTRNSLPAWFALIAATSLGLIVFSRGASFDIMITFPLTASAVCFFIWEQQHSRSENGRSHLIWLAAFYFFIGVGLLAKGLIGIVFPFAIVGFYFVLSRRWPTKEFLLSTIWGLALVVAVAGLWYVPMIAKHGWEFVSEFIIQHHFQRFTSNKYRHPGPFWYFFGILPAMTIPWIPFFLLSVLKCVGRIFKTDDSSAAKSDFITQYPALVKFAFAWMLVPLVFFSISGSKLPGYILPALPPAVVLTGLYLFDFVKTAKWRAALLKLAALIMLVTVFYLLVFELPRFAEGDSVKQMVAAADDAGYKDTQILNLHTISHNVEFYGSDRLVRDENGEQWKFLGIGGVVNHMRKHGGKPVLVLVPHAFENQITASPLVKSEVLGRDAKLSIIAVQISKDLEKQL